MKKIVYLPLDERPCNYAFPGLLLGAGPELSLVTPPASMLGDKKTPADVAALSAFLRENAAGAYALIVSVDMLLYGGIVPSRLHHTGEAELLARLDVLKELRQDHPKLKIYAFSLIMRCPQYSSADEEPDYYETCGREIFLLGEAQNKRELGRLTPEEEALIPGYEAKTAPYLADYLDRRRVNLAVNLACIELVGTVVDRLIIPQDDSAVFGFTAIDQQRVRRAVRESGKQLSVYMYPGADEVGMVLLARAACEAAGFRPKVAVAYSSTQGATVVPLYEDRIVGETIKYQILACGGIPVDTAAAADFVLFVNTPSANMTNANMANLERREYAIERNVVEFAERAAWYVSCGKAVAVADVAYVNGGDVELLELLGKLGVLFRLAAYAGWNTSSNTIGTALAQACLYCLYGDTPAHRAFLALRYYEDAGYCAHTRKTVCDEVLPGLGLNYFDSGEEEGTVSREVAAEIDRFMRARLPEVAKRYELASCRMPWRRMFEVALTVKERK